MATVNNFEDLEIWKLAREMASSFFKQLSNSSNNCRTISNHVKPLTTNSWSVS